MASVWQQAAGWIGLGALVGAVLVGAIVALAGWLAVRWLMRWIDTHRIIR